MYSYLQPCRRPIFARIGNPCQVTITRIRKDALHYSPPTGCLNMVTLLLQRLHAAISHFLSVALVKDVGGPSGMDPLH